MQIQTPTPTNPEQASLLFWVLLVLVVCSSIASLYAIYRSTRKQQAEESAAKADATVKLQQVIAGMGSTYDDLVANVRETAEIQIEAKYRQQITELTEQVNQLKTAVEEAATERQQWERTAGAIDQRYRIDVAALKQRIAALEQERAQVERESEARYRGEIDALEARVKAIETEREEDRAGLEILLAQLGRMDVKPDWKPKTRPTPAR